MPHVWQTEKENRLKKVGNPRGDGAAAAAKGVPAQDPRGHGDDGQVARRLLKTKNCRSAKSQTVSSY